MHQKYNYEKDIKGSGLGLSITKRLVSELYGEIKLTSEKGIGSEFIIEIPLKSAVDLQNSISTSTHVVSQNLKNITVLVVEDDPTQLKMVTEMIRKKGLSCIGVTDTDKVLLQLRNNIFDIIFVDINLKVSTGIELIKEIYETEKELLTDTPIIALSAASDVTKDELQSFGFTDFLPKPFTSEDLFGMINIHTNSGVMISDDKEELSNGLMSLIEYVKDDDKQSSEILQSFIDETLASNKLLKAAFEQKDYVSARKVSHKMLPLIKMIGDNQVISMVEHLEKGNQLSEEKESLMVVELERYVLEAEKHKAVIVARLNERN